MFDLKNKVVCVIGNNGLIGKPLVRFLKQADCTLYLFSRNNENEVIENKFFYRKMDISLERNIKKEFDFVNENSGKLDVLINCSWPRIDYGENIEPENIDSELMIKDINNHLIGYFNCCKYAAEIMKKNKRGSIVNLGSIYGERIPNFSLYDGTEIKKEPTYFLIKSGIHMMSKYFAEKYSKFNIRVNVIACGGVYNNHSLEFNKKYCKNVPLNRMANPDDIVGPIVFLSSDASKYTTGHILNVDGGLCIR